MKKYLFPLISSMIIGYTLATFLFKQYDYSANITSVFNNGVTVSLIQQGVYSTKDSMESSLSSFSYYIYTFENEMYYAYIGITKNNDNLSKLKGYFENKGYSIYVRDIYVNNNSFLEILEQYDNLLSKADSDEMIDALMMQALSKYEEMISSAS